MALSKCGSFTVGKGWRRTIGWKVGNGGRLMPCRFWLGMDEPRATATALAIESIWVGLQKPYWTAEAWATAEAIRVGTTAKDAPRLTAGALGKAMATPKTVLTFGGLIDRYRQAKMNDASLSDASKHSIACRTKSLERSPMAQEPMASVSGEQLSALVRYWLNRPLTPKGEQLSECSSRLIVKTARAVCDWADAVGIWLAPRRFDDIFRLPKHASAPVIVTYSVDELKRLYKSATADMRLLILLALNCGFCSSELATLKRQEIDLQNNSICRRRQKTAVPMTWRLWNETVKALKRGMSHDGELALTNRNATPLVWYSPKRARYDVICRRWLRLRKRAKVGHGSFKTLRKTAATMMRSIGGVEVSELFLAHSEKSMARYYSRPDPKAMAKALTTMRRRLAPMFILQL